MNHKERVNYSLEISKRLFEMKTEYSLSESDFKHIMLVTHEKPLSLHPVFMAAFMTQASQEQLQQYEDDAKNFRIMGCYAQTELAHGSNVQGLMTTATYIPETDMFDIHTPCIEATKWWVGALGKTATHAIVYARLILPDGDYGVHGFFIQIRSLEDHKPLPGITVGDIGPKLGFHGVDNGFMQLNHVKAPRTCLLSRFSQVLKGGKYVKPPHNKLGYTGMTATRVSIVSTSATAVAKAATIATRYSIVRRQFGEKGKKERQVIEYITQQRRIFNALADSYAIHFIGMYLEKLLQTTQSNLLGGGKVNLLQELHSTSSGLKALCTWMAVKGIEDCRRCCGGHGYSSFSGLVDLYTYCNHVVTAEGENYIMTQQTAKFLMKTIKESLKGPSSPLPEYHYLSELKVLSETCIAQNPEDFLNPEVQLHAYKHRALRIVAEMSQSISSDVTNGISFEDSWNRHLQEACKASNSHCIYLLLSNFVEETKKSSVHGNQTYQAMKLLCDYFAITHMEEDLMDFYEDGYLSKKQVGFIRSLIPTLLKQIRENAVGYADSWNFSDYVLTSAIGGYDGNVYETLLDWAKSDPINKNDVLDCYQTALKPIFQGKL